MPTPATKLYAHLEYRPTTVNGTLRYLIRQARTTPELERSTAQQALLADTTLMAAVLRARQALAAPQNATQHTVCEHNLQAARTKYLTNQALYTPLLNACLIDAYYHNQAVARLLATPTPDGTL